MRMRSLFALLCMPWRVAGWSLSPHKGPKLSGSAAAVTADGRILMFGGLDEERKAVDALWCYEEGAWREVVTTGSAPGPRMYAAAAAQTMNGGSREDFLVTGGWDPGAKGSGGSFKESAYALDTKSMAWLKEDALPCGPVSRHAAATAGGRVYVHTFRGNILRRDAESGVIKTHATTGDAPDGLSMASMAPLSDDRVLVFGGTDKTQNFSRDARVLDAATYEWTKLDVSGGPGPSPRGSCAAAAVDANRILVFGGAGVGGDGYSGGAGLVATDETWLLTVNGGVATWELLVFDSAPPPRVAASLAKCGEGKFLLTGGWDPKSGATFDDVWTIAL